MSRKQVFRKKNSLAICVLMASSICAVSMASGNFGLASHAAESGIETPPTFANTSKEKLPNIVIVLADDLGYGDVQPLNNSSKIPTPSFDRLAEQGMKFTNAHSASAVCTPTRYGIMCGRYPWRSPMKRGVLAGYSRPLIEADRQTIASVLKRAGYSTGCVGKWHLGLGWQWTEEAPSDINNMGIAGGKPKMVDYSKPLTHGPNTLGFDYSFIIPASLDMSPYVFIRNDRVTTVPDKVIDGKGFPQFYRKGEIADDFEIENVLDTLTKEACSFISDSTKTDKPFFLYFPLSAPHKPVMPHSRFAGKTDLGPYGDFVTQVDSTLGEIMKALDQADVADNTLLIVTSDNGSFMYRYDDLDVDHCSDSTVHGFNPDNHQANGALRGTKADIWEAGHRVPFFVRWPGNINSQTTCDDLICQVDLLATLADVVGAEFKDESAQDSVSFLAALKQMKHERRPVIHQSGSGHLAVRQGDWKLVMGTGSGGREKPIGKSFEQPFQLFDLGNDLGETTNVIKQHSEMAEQLYKSFLEIADGDHLDPNTPNAKK